MITTFKITNDDSKNANPEYNQPTLLNEEQEYWQQCINPNMGGLFGGSF